MGAEELSALLWKERELLELLIFKLEEEQLILTSGKTRWLQHATREVEQVLERLRAAGLARTVEVGSVAAEWGTPEEATLRQLAGDAPPGPWSSIFAAHLKAMTESTTKIRELRETNEQYLRAASRSTQETLATLESDAGTYGSRGTSNAASDAWHMLDKDL
ncbi:flagellar protein FlgN [Arthrobacter roseus]|uniref:flagellar protein FlgN n=1 Tax=Arthrobacter roseus TaxID=136274 RepID=UPI0019659765|nr:flagellar protein FlgN [Arthrobacter roseus]MBM7847650.1 flagellar biosynthesis/type III secretory pathway chaperone [Arthrobacter roseus]